MPRPFAIETGLFARQVLQRNRRDCSDQSIAGTAPGPGNIRFRVEDGAGKAVRGLADGSGGTVSRGRFAFRLKGIPVGGPYRVEVTWLPNARGQAAQTLAVDDVLVGDVTLLAGQSNMEGIGYLKAALPPDPHVRCFRMRDEWTVAADPLHVLREAVDPVHHEIKGGTPERPRHVGVGPGMAFARDMLARTGVPQGLIPCAHGGTGMAAWDPRFKTRKGHSLYGASIRRLRKSGGRVSAVLWYQGESDTDRPESVAAYTANMRRLVAAFRRDANDPRLPFVMVQIGRVVAPDRAQALAAARWNAIQEKQRLLAQVIERLAVVPAVDLDLDDAIHISGEDQNRLGRRLARATAGLIGLKNAGKPPIAPGSLRVARNPHTGNAVVDVSFRNVTEALASPGRPLGFSLVDAAGHDHILYKTTLHGNRVRLWTRELPEVIRRRVLYYGYGTNPACTITDAADRSLPVFGPVSLAE
ncbi:MAG: sialate O-acetylesterase [Opitutales bacterium]